MITLTSNSTKKCLERVGELSFLCRGCLSESGEMKNMFEWGLAEDFYKFTDVKVNESDEISALLCTTCEGVLGKCKSFRLNCQKSDAAFRSRLKKKNNESFVEAPKDPVANCDVIDKKKNEGRQENLVLSTLLDNELQYSVVAPDMQSKILFTCPYLNHAECHQSFSKQRYLMIHLCKIHNIDESCFSIKVKYFCSYPNCSYSNLSESNKFFTGRKFLNQHYNKVHKTKEHSCYSCEFVCSTETELKRHLKNCNKLYKCHVCEENYKSNERLLVHLKRKHPLWHKHYKEKKQSLKLQAHTAAASKKAKVNTELQIKIDTNVEHIVKADFDNPCESPKRSLATQTLEENITNEINLTTWNQFSGKSDHQLKTDSTQTVFEDILSLKSQASEDDSMFFADTVSLSDIQTQTFPLNFDLHRCNKETITSETQSPDLSIKETQTCVCLFDSPKHNFKLFDSISSSPSNISLMSTETQTVDLSSNVKSDVMLSFSSIQTQTCFDSVGDEDTF